MKQMYGIKVFIFIARKVLVFDPTSLPSKVLRHEIGYLISKYRKQESLSQQQLAECMGISKSTISKIENGKFSISLDYLEKIAYVFVFTIIVTKVSEEIAND